MRVPPDNQAKTHSPVSSEKLEDKSSSGRFIPESRVHQTGLFGKETRELSSYSVSAKPLLPIDRIKYVQSAAQEDDDLPQPKSISFSNIETLSSEEAHEILTIEALKEVASFVGRTHRRKNHEILKTTAGELELDRYDLLASGGSKEVYYLSTENDGEYALALCSNADMRKWEEAIKETEYCAQFRTLGLMTHPVTKLISVSADKVSFPAILMRPFSSLNAKVLDAKSSASGFLNETDLKGKSGQYIAGDIANERELRDALAHLAKETAVLATMEKQFSRETCNFCLLDGELHLFLFDTQESRDLSSREKSLEIMAERISAQLICSMFTSSPLSPFMKELRDNEEKMVKLFTGWAKEELENLG